MMEVKKLGRPKNKAKNPDDGCILHVVLSREAKERFERLKMYYRCELYDARKHGTTPNALPRLNNEALTHFIIENAHRVTMTELETLTGLLTLKGCLNAAELLGLPEGQEQ
jgi:hypothetical protein